MSVNVLVFAITAVLALASGAGVILFRNAIHGALSLAGNMVCLAIFYLLLSAQFVAVIQVIVYAGAIMVLFLFVIALLSPERDAMTEQIPGQRILAGVFALALLADVGLFIGRDRLGQPGTGSESLAGFGHVEEIGVALFTRYLLPFEATSLLLVVAAIGAIYLSRRTDP